MDWRSELLSRKSRWKRIGVLEYVLAGGLDPETALAVALLPEALAMFRAAVRGFVTVPGVELVICAVHPRYAGELKNGERVEPRTVSSPESGVLELCATCDALLIVAPEIDDSLGRLLSLAHSQATETGCCVLSVSPPLTRLFSNKVETYRWLERHSIPAVPHWPVLRRSFARSGPMLLKPVDGAGCEGIRLRQLPDFTSLPDGFCCSPFVAGCSFSGLALLGPAGAVLLPAAYQWIKLHGGLTYSGGAIPAPAPVAGAVRRLLDKLVHSAGNQRGFLGLDCVVPWNWRETHERKGYVPAYVVEVNPRMTTSAVAQSAATGVNIFHLLLGLQLTTGSFRTWHLTAEQAVTFSARGEVRSYRCECMA